MTTATPTSALPGAPSEAQPGQQLAKAFAEALCQAISAQANATWSSRVLQQTDELSAERGDTATVSLRLSGGLTGELFLSLDTKASANLLSALDPAAAGDPVQAWLTLCTAAVEIFLASPAPLCDALTINSCQLLPLPQGSHPLAHLELTTPKATPGALVAMAADATLVADLTRLQDEARHHPPSLDEAEDDPNTQIERVIDVPLAVTLRFGQRHLTLRDVLALNSGSLVELDRQVEEPVDLVLGDRLIARGEVVIVDGNYGLRITEIVQGAANRIRRAHAATAAESQPAGRATV